MIFSINNTNCYSEVEPEGNDNYGKSILTDFKQKGNLTIFGFRNPSVEAIIFGDYRRQSVAVKYSSRFIDVAM